MVDFNNESTVGQPAIDIERVLILQRRDAVIEAVERYLTVADQSGSAPIEYIKGRLTSFYLQLYGMLERKYKDDKRYAELKRQIQSNDFTELMESFYFMSSFLDSINLTKLDTRENYDKSILVAEYRRTKKSV